MQLNRHKFKTVHVTAREAARPRSTCSKRSSSSAVKQLAQDVLQDIFCEITNANYGAPAIPALAAATFDYKKVLAVREACSRGEDARQRPRSRARWRLLHQPARRRHRGEELHDADRAARCGRGADPSPRRLRYLRDGDPARERREARRLRGAPERPRGGNALPRCPSPNTTKPAPSPIPRPA